MNSKEINKSSTTLLENIVVQMLMERNITISIAESCTGGMVSSRITNIPGVSEIFMDSIVTYSNNAKVNLLGVDEETLNTYGAVSQEIAEDMAKCIKRISNTDIGLSITGIAGPGGGSVMKPVGLVFIGLCYNNRTTVYRFNFTGDRDKIRKDASDMALEIVKREILLNK